jgi:hypothetical protein
MFYWLIMFLCLIIAIAVLLFVAYKINEAIKKGV